MLSKPNVKPSVLDWLNPLANGWLTIRQDNTIQDKVGFGSLNQNQNPPFVLSVNLTSKVSSLASSLCGLVLRGSFERQQNGFPQVFNRVFNNDAKRGVFDGKRQGR